MKEIWVGDKKIQIYDGLYSYAERTKFYEYVTASYFMPKGKDNSSLETQGHYNLFSGYSEEDFKSMGLMESSSSKDLKDQVRGMKWQQTRVNLSTLNDKNHFHCDYKKPGLTLLYYPNLEWNIEWGGYTLFANEDMTEIEYCSLYVPGRVILFDGRIPHCIAAPTNMAPSYRFSLATQYTY